MKFGSSFHAPVSLRAVDASCFATPPRIREERFGVLLRFGCVRLVSDASVPLRRLGASPFPPSPTPVPAPFFVGVVGCCHALFHDVHNGKRKKYHEFAERFERSSRNISFAM